MQEKENSSASSKSSLKGHQPPVSALLARRCSSPPPSVFSSTQELVARLRAMNHGVLSAFTPVRLPAAPTGAFLPSSPRKAKNAQSSVKSALRPRRDPSPSFSPLSCQRGQETAAARSSCQPLSPCPEHPAERGRARERSEVPSLLIQPRCLEAGRCLSHRRPGSAVLAWQLWLP